MAAKTYPQILTKGVKSDLAKSDIKDGILRYTTDTGELYLDIKTDSESKRLKISDIDNTKTEEQIMSIIAPLPKIYVSSDTHRAFVSNGISMIDLAEIDLDIAETIDADSPIWFKDSSEDGTNNPKYSTDATYNVSTKELKAPILNATGKTIKVGSVQITDTLNADNTHTVDFSFI